MFKVIEKNIYEVVGTNDIQLRYTFAFNGKRKNFARKFDKSELEKARIINYKIGKLEKKHQKTNNQQDYEEYLDKVFEILYEDICKLNVLENEEWRDIDDIAPGYMVSNLGRLCHLKDHDGRIEYKIIAGHIWDNKVCKGKTKYLADKITVNGECLNRKRHRLVAHAFIPNPDNLPEINHIDGNGLNNNVNNLEWVTSHENALHARRVLKKGLNIGNTGEICSSSKLTWNIVNSIREEYKQNPDLYYTDLAEKYNVQASCIGSIIRNKNWVDKNYTPPENDNYHKKMGYIKIHKPKKYLIANQSRITTEQAKEIREKYYNDKVSQVTLAKEYNISRALVSDIVNNKRNYGMTNTNTQHFRTILYEGKEYTTIKALEKTVNRSYKFVYDKIVKCDINENNQIVLPDGCLSGKTNIDPKYDVGDIVNGREIIRYEPHNGTYKKYICKCLNCGEVYNTRAQDLQNSKCHCMKNKKKKRYDS